MKGDFFKDIFFELGIYRHAKKYLTWPYFIVTGFLFSLNGRAAIRQFVAAMDEHDQQYWLEFGTLLGAIRENRIMSHDMDLDVGVMRKDRNPNLEEILKKHQFKLVKKSRLLTGELIEESYKYRTAKIDIFYAYEKEEKIIMYDYCTFNDLSPNECMKRYGGLEVSENVLDSFDLIKHSFYDFEVFVPDNYCRHLEELYGNDFMIPDKKWSLDSRSVRQQTNHLAEVE